MDKRRIIIEGLEDFIQRYREAFDDGGEGILVDVLALLKEQTPCLMSLEELEHAEVAYAEDKGKADIIPVLVLGRMCEHVALVKPHVDEDAITRMIIPRADDYGVRWRCWSSRPTDAQREAASWEE